MNDYFYKPKIKSLPKLPLTTSTTYHTTFYSNGPKTKNNSINNSHKILNSNENTIIFNSNKNNK